MAIFGAWPSFHDAEICRARLDRNGPWIEFEIFVFSTTRTTDERGFYKRINETLVTLRFDEIEDLVLEGFNHQNVLASLTIERTQKINVVLDPIFGLGGKFSCTGVEVVRAAPYVAPAKVR
jgi:hypothetical protein